MENPNIRQAETLLGLTRRTGEATRRSPSATSERAAFLHNKVDNQALMATTTSNNHDVALGKWSSPQTEGPKPSFETARSFPTLSDAQSPLPATAISSAKLERQEMHSSQAGEGIEPAVHKSCQEPGEKNLEKYRTKFETDCSRIKGIYHEVLGQLAPQSGRSKHKKKIGPIRLEIVSQNESFRSIIKSLVKNLPRLQSEDVVSDCSLIGTELDSILGGLDSISSRTKILCDKQEMNKVDFSRTKRVLRKEVDALSKKVDNLEKLTLRLSAVDNGNFGGCQSASSNDRQGHIGMQQLERLCIEGRTSARLYECLCRICPVPRHDEHTAYIRLEPERSDNITERNRPETECDMAIKSTIREGKALIWLKVRSSMTEAVRVQPTGGDNNQSKLLPTTAALMPSKSNGNNPRKRRASSPESRASKAPKTSSQSVRRRSDPAPSSRDNIPSDGIQVCPEYLAQHDETDHAVMKMVDSSGCDHRVYYLPSDKRPCDSDNPISLSTLLDPQYWAGRECQPEYRYGKLDKLRLARLIAEAVLRFDLHDSDPHCPWDRDSVIFYRSSAKKPEPFLEVRIKKADPTLEPNTVGDHRLSLSSRRMVLLNLGVILIQLGLSEPQTLSWWTHSAGLKESREFILKMALETTSNMHRSYSDAVRHCATLFDSQEGKDLEEQSFQESYYISIVQPLKELEEFLESCQ